MATSLKNLSQYNPEQIPDAGAYKFGIAVSEWNHDITGALLQGALDTLKRHGVSDDNITTIYVPGSFELTNAARHLALQAQVDAVIAIGCVIRGDTPHFDYVCQGVTQGIAALNTMMDTPVIYGVLTTNNLQQSLDRAGGIHGNKGVEAAITAIKMADIACTLKK